MTDIPGITAGEAAEGAEWTCPFCGRAQTITHPKKDEDTAYFHIEKAAEGRLGLHTVALGCANPECRRTTIGTVLINWLAHANGYKFIQARLQTYRLQPRGREVPLPEYVPPAIRKDYTEASLIIDLSPNASAALARRCLQGVLMDFAGVKKGLLVTQIKELKQMLDDRVAADGITVRSLDAIEHVREFGNIGAHMEQPTGTVVDVEPEEAVLLLELVETLFRDWYIERHDREARYQRLSRHAEAKRELRAEAKAEREVAGTAESAGDQPAT